MELALTQLPVRLKEPNLEKDSAIVKQLKYGLMMPDKLPSYAPLMMLEFIPSLTASVTTKLLIARCVHQIKLL
jgi:hypothetical protein